MNGCVAKLTRLPRRLFGAGLPKRNLRTLLLAAACVMSLALLGAVRLAPQFRPDSLEAGEQPMAEWNDDHVPLGALNTIAESKLVNPSLPAGVELLRDSNTTATAMTASAVMSPSVVVPIPLPAPKVVIPRMRTVMMEVTAYCACPKCCGPRAQGLTASGRRVDYNGGRFVAADTRLFKFNTKLRIPGYSNNLPVEVIDKGGAIKGNKLDVFFPTHQEARAWGRQKLAVTVIEE